MSKSRKWVASALVAASMIIVGTAAALDDALVSKISTEVTTALSNVSANATEEQRVEAIKSALAGKTEFDGKVDELIQALSNAGVADAVAVKVIVSAAPTMTPQIAANSFGAAKEVTKINTTGNTNPVTAAGTPNVANNAPVVQSGGTSSGSSFGSSFSGAPSSLGGGTGQSRT